MNLEENMEEDIIANASDEDLSDLPDFDSVNNERRNNEPVQVPVIGSTSEQMQQGELFNGTDDSGSSDNSEDSSDFEYSDQSMEDIDEYEDTDNDAESINEVESGVQSQTSENESLSDNMADISEAETDSNSGTSFDSNEAELERMTQAALASQLGPPRTPERKTPTELEKILRSYYSQFEKGKKDGQVKEYLSNRSFEEDHFDDPSNDSETESTPTSSKN